MLVAFLARTLRRLVEPGVEERAELVELTLLGVCCGNVEDELLFDDGCCEEFRNGD